MCNEILRPRENSCKWFNILRVMRRRLYIVRSEKSKFSHKNNMVNRFTKWVNRFRQEKYKTTSHEEWHDSVHMWIDSSEPSMKNDVIQPFLNLFSASQRVLWYDSYCDESIHMWYDSKKWWIVSFEVRDFIWYGSMYDESIQQVKRWTMTLFWWASNAHDTGES